MTIARVNFFLAGFEENMCFSVIMTSKRCFLHVKKMIGQIRIANDFFSLAEHEFCAKVPAPFQVLAASLLRSHSTRKFLESITERFSRKKVNN